MPVLKVTCMRNRIMAAAVAASLLGALSPAHAENKMGYRFLSAQDAAQLPHNKGALGMDVERAQQISDGGLTFDIMRVKQVRSGSAGARAGFRTGDMIIAVDGQVFPSIAAFAAYVGSVTPGQTVSVDYMPSGGGPAQAQRLSVVVGGPGTARTAPAAGLSTGQKLAIGAGAVALFGCYEMGCFSHRTTPAPDRTGMQNPGQMQGQVPMQAQPR